MDNQKGLFETFHKKGDLFKTRDGNVVRFVVQWQSRYFFTNGETEYSVDENGLVNKDGNLTNWDIVDKFTSDISSVAEQSWKDGDFIAALSFLNSGEEDVHDGYILGFEDGFNKCNLKVIEYIRNNITHFDGDYEDFLEGLQKYLKKF